MYQATQIAGALLILIAFAMVQMKRMDPHGRLYLALNFVGSLVLTILAAMESQWGFLLLEGVWALVSGWGLIVTFRKRPAVAPVV